MAEREIRRRPAYSLLVAGIALMSVAATCGTDGSETPEGQTTSSDAAVLADWDIAKPGGLSFGFGSVWMPDSDEVLRIDPTTNETIATIEIGAGAGSSTLALGSVWVETNEGTFRIDPVTNEVTGTIPAGRVFGFGSFWAWTGFAVERIDPETGEAQEIEVPDTTGGDWEPQLAVGLGSVWVGSGDAHKVFRIDPVTDKVVATVDGISEDYSLLVVGVGFGSAWAHANAAGESGILYRIDPASNEIVATIPVGDGSGGEYGGTQIAFSADSVWTADSSSTISQIDPRTNEVTAVVDATISSPQFIAFGFDSIWTNSEFTNQAVRLDASSFA